MLLKTELENHNCFSMKKIFAVIAIATLFVGCKKELEFKTIKFFKKTTMPCKQGCPQVSVAVPFAEPKSEVEDSINNKIFSVVQSIIYNEEAQKSFPDYEALLANFIHQYEKMQTANPEDVFGWEANVEGKIMYRSKDILNFEISHYSYTGGAHGYRGLRSILVNPKNGKSIPNKNLFVNESKFKIFAEKQFRKKFKLPSNLNINGTGLMFEDEKFQLPQNYFFNKDGLLLHYNIYEIASYAAGPQELLLPYEILKPYLKLK